MTRIPRIAAVLLLGSSILLFGSAGAAESDDVGSPDVTTASVVYADFLEFNMCGNKCFGGGFSIADATVSSIKTRSPQPVVVALNEVCWNQWDRLRDDLAANGYRAWFQWNGRNYCANGAYYGIAMLHKFSGTLVGNYILPDPGSPDEPRRMFCIQIGFPLHVSCVTHVDGKAENRGAQIASVVSRAEAFASKGYHVVVSGDFNAVPTDDTLDQVYAFCYGGGAFGRFWEATVPLCSRSGEATNDDGRKIDYVFATSGVFQRYADATYSASDHHPYWAGLTFNY